MDIRAAQPKDVLELFQKYHGYKSLGGWSTYTFAVYEDGRPVAAFSWCPPPLGACKNICPECPQAVLSLSRMVAVPREERQMKHISKALKLITRNMIDRTRWPVLVTYSDEGQGHTGHVYKCSGWKPTVKNKRPIADTVDGERVSTYSNGRKSKHKVTGTTTLQRWEKWIVPPGHIVAHMETAGWKREAIPGKVWASGNQAYRYVWTQPSLKAVDK